LKPGGEGDLVAQVNKNYVIENGSQKYKYTGSALLFENRIMKNIPWIPAGEVRRFDWRRCSGAWLMVLS
jgi:hypothetical protein